MVSTIPPDETNRAHLPQSDPRCDTIYVLNMAAKFPLGRRYADMNACRLHDSDANLHWPENAVRNGFEWMYTGKRDRRGREIRRPMTHAERVRPVADWNEAGFLRWRTAERGGKRPTTVKQRNRQAMIRLVRICWELKTRDYGADPAYAKRFVTACKGWVAYYMTLVTMANWGPKLRSFKEAGVNADFKVGGTALLLHGAERTPEISLQLTVYRSFIDKFWGHWA